MEGGHPDHGEQEQELHALLDAVYAQYGYDFRRYARASLTRRLRQVLRHAGLRSLAELERRVLGDGGAFQALLDALTVHVTEMFRDPPFYAIFREQVVPYIRTYPTL